MIIIDASNTVLGRLASYVAKQALLGKEVIVVNCEQAVVTGGRRMIIKEYQTLVYRGGHSLKGPFHNKSHAEQFVKRTIRGMLSYKQGRGAAAFGRIKCYTSVPKAYSAEKKISLPQAVHSTMTIKEVMQEL
ncbi:50S ribosomal protein L13 [Candidatus Pacearchaeota archaeon]|nr:50S ribosomal protein L13 [Candidatus Pacearchaeota archaeon]